VLIFDEATSALDSQSENAIMNTIYSLKGEITMILIAHRLSSLERCDRIAWIHDRSIKMVDRPERIIPEYERVIMSS
jgi:ABC-type bacteriocin/lantibiotic exporter with double-glycine peptidase domain